jgi:hypothetical protein
LGYQHRIALAGPAGTGDRFAVRLHVEPVYIATHFAFAVSGHFAFAATNFLSKTVKPLYIMKIHLFSGNWNGLVTFSPEKTH